MFRQQTVNYSCDFRCLASGCTNISQHTKSLASLIQLVTAGRSPSDEVLKTVWIFVPINISPGNLQFYILKTI
jgi:hypothetical protein